MIKTVEEFRHKLKDKNMKTKNMEKTELNNRNENNETIQKVTTSYEEVLGRIEELNERYFQLDTDLNDLTSNLLTIEREYENRRDYIEVTYGDGESEGDEVCQKMKEVLTNTKRKDLEVRKLIKLTDKQITYCLIGVDKRPYGEV